GATTLGLGSAERRHPPRPRRRRQGPCPRPRSKLSPSSAYRHEAPFTLATCAGSAPPAPPRPLPREQLQDVAVRVEIPILREEVVGRNAGNTLDEGGNRPTARNSRHAVDEQLPRRGVLVKFEHVV